MLRVGKQGGIRPGAMGRLTASTNPGNGRLHLSVVVSAGIRRLVHVGCKHDYRNVLRHTGAGAVRRGGNG